MKDQQTIEQFKQLRTRRRRFVLNQSAIRDSQSTIKYGVALFLPRFCLIYAFAGFASFLSRRSATRRRTRPSPEIRYRSIFGKEMVKFYHPSENEIRKFGHVRSLARAIGFRISRSEICNERKLHYFCTIFASFFQIEAVTNTAAATLGHVRSSLVTCAHWLASFTRAPISKDLVKKW